MLPLLLMLAGVQEAPAPAADPLAEARAGKIRCIQPDAAHLSCRSIVQYKPKADGSFDAMVSGFVGEDDTLIIYHTSGAVEGDAVCTVIRPYDLLHGALYRGGKPLGEADAAKVQDGIRQQLQDLAGKKRCFTDRAEGKRLVSAATLNGVVQPGTVPVAWVSPKDGYALSK